MKCHVILVMSIICLPLCNYTTQSDNHKLLQLQEAVAKQLQQEVTKQFQQNDQNKQEISKPALTDAQRAVLNASMLTVIGLGTLGTYKEYVPEKMQPIGNAVSAIPAEITAQLVKDFVQGNNFDTIFYELPILRNSKLEISTKNIAAALCAQNPMSLLVPLQTGDPIINIGPIQLYSKHLWNIVIGRNFYSKSADIYCKNTQIKPTYDKLKNSCSPYLSATIIAVNRLLDETTTKVDQNFYYNHFAIDAAARTVATVGYSLTNHVCVYFAEKLGLDDVYTNLFFAADKNSTKGTQQLVEWLIMEVYIRLMSDQLEKNNWYKK